MLADPSGRRTRYLRLSLTRGCSMRCTYCRPGFDRGRGLELSPVELEALVRHLAVRHGVTKVRLTGGNPTMRANLEEIIERLASVRELSELAMTTNGLTLARRAAAYRARGLGRVNVSLDSLDPATFARMTGVDELPRVLSGIDAAIAAGLGPVRLNTVVLRGENDGELGALLGFAAARQVELRFIELMPMGPLAGEWARRYVPEAEMREHLAGAVVEWERLPESSASARPWLAHLRGGGSARVGFITPMSHDFCGACDRIRIGADGSFYPCLMGPPAGSLLTAVRPTLDGDAVDHILAAGLGRKAPVHAPTGLVTMTHIGG